MLTIELFPSQNSLDTGHVELNNSLEQTDIDYQLHSHSCNSGFVVDILYDLLEGYKNKTYTSYKVQFVVSGLDPMLLHPVGRDGVGDIDCTQLVLGEFSCEVCDWHCYSNQQLRNHRQKQHIVQQCKVCDEVVPKKGMDSHARKHDNPSTHMCNDCPFTTAYASALKRHREAYHGAELKPFPCTRCDARFDTSEKLETHEFKAHQIKFPCQFCEKTYSSKDFRNRHTKAWVYIYKLAWIFLFLMLVC